MRHVIKPGKAAARSPHNTACFGFVWHEPAVRNGVTRRVKGLDIPEEQPVVLAKRPPKRREHELVEQAARSRKGNFPWIFESEVDQ